MTTCGAICIDPSSRVLDRLCHGVAAANQRNTPLPSLSVRASSSCSSSESDSFRLLLMLAELLRAARLSHDSRHPEPAARWGLLPPAGGLTSGRTVLGCLLPLSQLHRGFQLAIKKERNRLPGFGVVTSASASALSHAHHSGTVSVHKLFLAAVMRRLNRAR